MLGKVLTTIKATFAFIHQSWMYIKESDKMIFLKKKSIQRDRKVYRVHSSHIYNFS